METFLFTNYDFGFTILNSPFFKRKNRRFEKVDMMAFFYREIKTFSKRPFLSFQAARKICRKQKHQKEIKTFLVTNFCNSLHLPLRRTLVLIVTLFTIHHSQKEKRRFHFDQRPTPLLSTRI